MSDAAGDSSRLETWVVPHWNVPTPQVGWGFPWCPRQGLSRIWGHVRGLGVLHAAHQGAVDQVRRALLFRALSARPEAAGTSGVFPLENEDPRLLSLLSI